MTDNQQPGIVTANVLVGVLAGIAILLRVAARRSRNLPLESDDITIIAALPFAWSICACNIVASTYGLGRHADTLGPADLIRFAQTLFASQLLWAVTIPIIKISILMLYTRIFGVLAYFRYSALVLGVFSIFWGMMVVFVVSLACRPLKYTWTRSGEGSCIDETVFCIIGSGINVITDFIILVLPLRAAWSMHSLIQQKIQLTGIFLLGSFLARWVSLFQIHGFDRTWDFTLPTIWSASEACLGIVAACLPTLKPLLQKSQTSEQSQTTHSSPFQSSRGTGSKAFKVSFSSN